MTFQRVQESKNTIFMKFASEWIDPANRELTFLVRCNWRPPREALRATRLDTGAVPHHGIMKLRFQDYVAKFRTPASARAKCTLLHY